MAALLDAQKLAACTERLAACRLRQRTLRPLGGSSLTQRTEVCKQSLVIRATAEAVAEIPTRKQTDEAAAKQDDDFPDVAPEEIAALPANEKYAVVDIGGVQMFVQEGRWYNCNRLQAEAGQTIKLGRVLAVKQDGQFNVGTPYLEKATVTAEIVEDLKGPKLTIFKMRRKKHYRRKTGHRQPLTQFFVSEIKG